MCSTLDSNLITNYILYIICTICTHTCDLLFMGLFLMPVDLSVEFYRHFIQNNLIVT
jgi:hypothetical protein